MFQLNLYQFLHGYSTGVCTQIIQFISGICLRHVPNVQGYFDGLLGDARQRTRYPWMELHYRLELEYKQCMWTQIMLYTKLPKTRVNTVGILKY